MIGIYKITSPVGKIYIGQAIDIDFRFKAYSKLQNCIGQIKLYRSFLKYGVENHTFEIIEECTIELLNERERHYQDLFDCISKNGLNLKLTKIGDRSGKYSKESCKKMSDSQKAKPTSERMMNAWKNNGYNKRGVKRTRETCEKISDSHKGKVISSSTRKKMSDININKTLSKDTKERISLGQIGRIQSEETKKKISETKKGYNLLLVK